MSLETVDEGKVLSTHSLEHLLDAAEVADDDSKTFDDGDHLPYVAMFSVHGLIRGESPELGRDLDTGGQVTYVLEVARKLSGLCQVDLFTRLIDDPSVSDDYKQPEETLAPGVKLIRIKCGPRRYIRKEMLWPFLDEFTDRTLKFILENRPVPIAVHGHYADGMLIASHLADILGVPMAITGHSMGRTKLRTLMKKMKYPTIMTKFKIDKRVEAEERALATCNLLISNSTEELISQWRLLYDGYQAYESIFRAVALKPGVGMTPFVWEHGCKETPLPSECSGEAHYPEIWRTIDHFLDDPDKPVILLLARPAPEKNLIAMVECFGESEELRNAANLVIIAGQRKDIDSMDRDQRDVLMNILKLIDKYDLYGTVSYPKSHSRSDVPAIFALPAYRRGAFANIALREPFGLTLIEAAVNGAPIIATTNGAGPEIVEKLQNGIVVDPSNKRAIIEAALTITTDAEKWQMFHENSLKKSHIYSWDGHVQQYSAFVGQLALESGMPPSPMLYPMTTDAKTRLDGDKVLLITDIDNTLLHGTEEGVAAFRRFVTLFRRNRDRLKLALATGRSVNSAVDYISSFDSKLISECEFLITSVGCEIHYWKDLSKTVKKGEKERTIKARVLCSDLDYHKHLSYRFSRNEIQSFIGANFPELEIQSEKTGHSGLEQRAYKLSYCVTKETGGFTDDELGFSPPATYDLSDGDDPSSPDLSSPEGGSAADIDEESSAESLLRAPSMVDLSRIGSADSLYSMGRVGSTYGLHKLGLHSVHSSASLANLAAVSSYSSLSTSIRGGLGTGETKQYQKYLKENGALNKHLHGTNLERNLKAMLRKQGFVCEVIVSHDRFVDILPIRASKGKAIRYLITRHRWPFERVAVSGDSGNDADMLSGLTRAIIVGNYATELSTLSMGKKVYFAKNCYADGIVEGLRQYFPTIV